MLPTASYNEVCAFANELSTVKENTIDDVYSMFVENKNFQNDYNIKQLGRMLELNMDTNILRDEAMVKITSMFISKYPQLHQIISKFCFPINSTIIVKTPDNTVEYRDYVMIVNKPKNTIIEICDEDENTLVKIHILDNMPKNENITYTNKGNIFLTDNINAKIEFFSTNNIHLLFRKYYEETKTPLSEAIFNDDFDYVQHEYTIHGETNMFHVGSPIREYNIYSNHERFLPDDAFDKWISFAIYCGSIKCFNFLLRNGLYKPSGKNDEIVIKSGSIEILRTLLVENLIHDTAAAYEYVIEKNDFNLFNFWFTHYEMGYVSSSILYEATRTYNYRALEMLSDENSIIAILWDGFNSYRYTCNEYHFELIDKYLNNAIDCIEFIHDIHIKYIADNIEHFEKLRKDKKKMLNTLIEHGYSVNVIKYVIKTLFKDDYTLDIKRSLFTKLADIYKPYTKRCKYIQELNIGVHKDLCAEVLHNYLSPVRSVSYLDLPYVRLLLDNVENITEVKCKEFFKDNRMYKHTRNYKKLVTLFREHGIEC